MANRTPRVDRLVKIDIHCVNRMTAKTRRYELKERARRQDETRRRIVDATVALHAEVGPARTTVAEIARRAGVSRLTVYNHFPDDESLLEACSNRFIAGSPPPDPGAWAAIEDPDARLRQALAERFAWFRVNEAMLGNVGRDAAAMPQLARVLASKEAAAYEATMRDVLLRGRDLRGPRERRVAGVLGLALSFVAWHQLVRQEGIDDDTVVVDVLARAVSAAA